jgi:hypothetical protein
MIIVDQTSGQMLLLLDRMEKNRRPNTDLPIPYKDTVTSYLKALGKTNSLTQQT